LRRLAAEDGKSLAELVRSGVELYLSTRQTLGQADRTERARRAAGRFHSGLKDVSRNHDRYLAEAFHK
jgi:hypothetical protein